MNTKLSRQQRRAMERAQTKANRKLNYPPKLIYVCEETGAEDFDLETSPELPFEVWQQDASIPLKDFQYEWPSHFAGHTTKIAFAGREIRGNVHFGKPPIVKNEIGEKLRPSHIYIDPELEIAENLGDSKYKFNSEAVAYDQLTPIDRANYLDWLATGKRDVSYDERYMVLYFMGLEWAYFNDYPQDDYLHSCILEEVLRLLELYPDGLNFALLCNIIYFDIFDTQLFRMLDPESDYEESNRMPYIAAHAGVNVLENEPINGVQLYWVLVKLKSESIEKVRQTCPYVFEKLFVSKFQLAYPNGIKITRPTKPLENNYQSLVQTLFFESFVYYDDIEVPDISSSTELKDIAIAIGNSVAKELKQYSDEIEDNIQNFKNKNRVEFLARSSNSEINNIGDQILLDWVTEKLKNSGEIPVNEVARLLNFESGLEFTEWYRLTVALERLGYGIAPDFGFDNSLSDESGLISIFKLESSPKERTEGSENYFTALLSITIGFVLFNFENSYANDQLSAISSRVNCLNLTKYELEQINAIIRNLQNIKPDLLYFMVLYQTEFLFDPEFIRESVKLYTELDGSIKFDKLDDLIQIYYISEIDYSDLKADLKLSGESNDRFDEMLNSFLEGNKLFDNRA